MDNFESLEDLRVIDLKKELEKFGLPKTGSKKELVDRLRAHLDSSENLQIQAGCESQSDTESSQSTEDNEEAEMDDDQNKSINDSVIEIVKNPDYSDDNNSGEEADNENSLNISNEISSNIFEINTKLTDALKLYNEDQNHMDITNELAKNRSNIPQNINEIHIDNSDDIIEKPKDEKKDGPDVYEELRATSRKILLSDTKTEDCGHDGLGVRKRRWVHANNSKTSINIGSETLKSIVGEVVFEETANLQEEMMELATEPMVNEFDDHHKDHRNKEQGERRKSGGLSRTIFQEIKENQMPGELGEETVYTSNLVIISKSDDDDKNRQLVLNSMDIPLAVAQRSPSPPKKAITNYLHIHNLVRPFTLIQLKQLLSQTGTMVEDGFWIDKIKSHCIVVYTTSEEAIETRKALHGKKWPLSNPKTLRVDFSTEEEFTMCKNSKETIGSKSAQQMDENYDRHGYGLIRRSPSPHNQSSLRDLRGQVRNVVPMREWDRDKVLHSRSRSIERQRRRDGMDDVIKRRPGKEESKGGHRSKEEHKRHSTDKKSRERREHPSREHRERGAGEPDPRVHASRERKDHSRDKGEKKLRSEEKKTSVSEGERLKQQMEDEQPAKLLDDLFKKTKTTPCIYWLPLTEEQIQEKELFQKKLNAEREKRRLERERANEDERKMRDLEREKRRLLREKEEIERQARLEQERERRRGERKKRHSSNDSR